MTVPRESSPLDETVLAHPDWMAIGLVLAIVGSFLLANSILFRHPRQLVPGDPSPWPRPPPTPARTAACCSSAARGGVFPA